MEQLFGYNGKIAYVDLSSLKVEVKDLDPKIVGEYLGGVGLSAKITYDLLSDADYETLRHDPFSSVNPLIFATGPLTGTVTPSSSRYSVTGISPLTGIWGESTSGGFFPIALRKSGFDAIVITGQAPSPKYIVVREGKIIFAEADKLWGKNTRETIGSIRNELNDDNIRIACIGKGGEYLVKYAAIMNDEGRAAGRCGLGAIMGKKLLKAIAVKGGQKIEYADRDVFIDAGKRLLPSVINTMPSRFIRNHGTLCYTDMGMVLGDTPAYYFTSTEFIAEGLTGKKLKEQYPVINYSCAGCQIGCGRTTITEMDGEEIEIDGPEYETTAAFGPMCGILNFKPILKANHMCNLAGLDTISSGVCISFLLYLNEFKVAINQISSYLSEIKIEELKWGNADVVVKLLDQIIHRRGIGKLLGEGVRIMAEKLGVDPDLAAHVKGLEIPMHDARAYHGQALTYMTGSIGASHCKGDFYQIDGKTASFRKVIKGDRFNIDGREASVKFLQEIANIFDSAVICHMPHLGLPVIGRLIMSSTGIPSIGNMRKLLLVGERCFNIKRLISCKLGLTREDDKLPKIASKTLETGGSAMQKLELEQNLKKYYEFRKWDWETGWPTEEKLRELGIL